jgi:hypothetical protein
LPQLCRIRAEPGIDREIIHHRRTARAGSD